MLRPQRVSPESIRVIQVPVVTEEHWENLCVALDRTDLVDDPAFATLEDRRETREERLELLNATFADRQTADWVTRLLDHDVPVQEVNDTLSVWDDPHTKERAMTFDVETPNGESFPTVAYPVKNRSWDWSGDDYIAEVGADTEAVLRNLGYSDERLAKLEETGVI